MAVLAVLLSFQTKVQCGNFAYNQSVKKRLYDFEKNDSRTSGQTYKT